MAQIIQAREAQGKGGQLRKPLVDCQRGSFAARLRLMAKGRSPDQPECGASQSGLQRCLATLGRHLTRLQDNLSAATIPLS